MVMKMAVAPRPHNHRSTRSCSPSSATSAAAYSSSRAGARAACPAQQSDVGWFVLIGITGIFVGQMFAVIALKFISPLNAALSQPLQPILTAILASCLGLDALRLRAAAGAATVAGILLAVAGARSPSSATRRRGSDEPHAVGDLIIGNALLLTQSVRRGLPVRAEARAQLEGTRRSPSPRGATSSAARWWRSCCRSRLRERRLLDAAALVVAADRVRHPPHERVQLRRAGVGQPPQQPDDGDRLLPAANRLRGALPVGLPRRAAIAMGVRGRVAHYVRPRINGRRPAPRAVAAAEVE